MHPLNTSGLFSSRRQKKRELKIQLFALALAYRDPRVPGYARLFTLLLVAYAFSPVDLIPDFIPVLGYLDDLVILPLGVVLVLKMIPPQVLKECRAQAEVELASEGPQFRWMGVVMIAGWLIVIFLFRVGVLCRIYRR